MVLGVELWAELGVALGVELEAELGAELRELGMRGNDVLLGCHGYKCKQNNYLLLLILDTSYDIHSSQYT